MVGEKILGQMRTAHRQLASSGKVVIIGITDHEMRASASANAASILSVRVGSSAIISLAEMDERRLGRAANEELLEERLRKMVARYVGVLFYRLPPSTDPRSLLFRGLDGVDELDFVDGDYSRSGMLPEL
jgi:hypothetical protein